MANTKKKNHWYIIVMAGDGPAFVTSVDHMDRTAHWDKDKTPLELSESMAKDIALGLMCNMYLAYAVCSPIEIDNHPYNYSMFEIEWKKKEAEK